VYPQSKWQESRVSPCRPTRRHPSSSIGCSHVIRCGLCAMVRACRGKVKLFIQFCRKILCPVSQALPR
jgi:hypothetical protein